jgi:uncharacterized RDD family membrane protein YckC
MKLKRILAGFIDFIICAILQAFLLFVFIIYPMLQKTNQNDVVLKNIYITFLSVLFLIIRDILGKHSLGKYLTKIKIIDRVTGSNVSPLRRLLRNLTWLLGPIEILFFFIKGKRIGDLIAKTDVIKE